MAFRFESLTVWQKSVDYAVAIYEITSRFPDDEKFGLTNQLRRASVSVSSNIAEGSGRTSDIEKGRFIGIAYGSLMETVSQIRLSQRLGYIDEGTLNEINQSAEEIAKLLSGYRNSLGRKKT